MVGLVEQSLFKVIERVNLTKQELGAISIDIETVLNNRPLRYIKNYIQMTVLTSNTLMYGQLIMIPKGRLDEDTPEIKKTSTLYQQM